MSLDAIRTGWTGIVPGSRADFEARLEAIIAENRFTIAVVFPVVGGVTLVGSAEGWLPSILTFNAWLILVGVLVMRSPLIGGLLPLFDRRAVIGVGLLTAYTFVIEHVGVRTGWPYGHFEYGVSLGPMLGGVPLALPIFFIPIAMNAYLLCVLLFGSGTRVRWVRLTVVIAAVVAMDVVLDPAAVSLAFWAYDGGGGFYDVPLSNYLGWILSATVAVVALEWSFDLETLRERAETCPFLLDDLVSFVILWGVVNVWFGNWIPAVIAVVFGVALVRADRFDAGLFRP